MCFEGFNRAEKIYNELVEAGLFSAGPVPNSLVINSYLRMKND